MLAQGSNKPIFCCKNPTAHVLVEFPRALGRSEALVTRIMDRRTRTSFLYWACAYGCQQPSQHFSKCACSERKTCTGSRFCLPFQRSLIFPFSRIKFQSVETSKNNNDDEQAEENLRNYYPLIPIRWSFNVFR